MLILIAMLLIALVVANCGGDDDSGGDDSTTADSTTTEASTTEATTTEAAAATREEFIGTADAICAANDERQNELRTELDNAASPEEAAVVYDTLADNSEATVNEIAALPRPEADVAAIDELIALQTNGIGLVRGLAEAVRANDQATGEDLIAQLEQNAAQADAADAVFGFEVCGA